MTTTAYCPFDLVKALPYAVWKTAKGQKNVVSDTCFANNKLYEHPWRFFCIWDDRLNPEKALILVERSAVDGFVKQVKRRFPNLPFNYPLPSKVPGSLLMLDSTLGIALQNLGSAITTDEFQVVKQMAEISSGPPIVDTNRREELRTQIDDSLHCVTNMKGKAKQRIKADRDGVAKRSLIGFEQYLGLADVTNQSIIDHKSFISASDPPPHPSFTEPIFVSVDVEAYEVNANMITEIGIATVDTRDLLANAPGAHAENWRKHIRGRHFRIREYAHLRNSRFVNGCPEAFQYGESEYVLLRDIAAAVATCFRQPYSFRNDPNLPHTEQVVDATTQNERRNIVLVGHSTSSDIAYLRKAGYDITNLPNLIATLDTNTLWSALTGDNNTVKLGRLCEELEIEPWFLHNAGNDAWYTMAVALAFAVDAAAGKPVGERLRREREEKEREVLERVAAAKRDKEGREAEEARRKMENLRLRENARETSAAAQEVQDERHFVGPVGYKGPVVPVPMGKKEAVDLISFSD